jgi:hypothetical protein
MLCCAVLCHAVLCATDVYEVLAASHYTLLTTEEWDLATSENFNLNLPMEVGLCRTSSHSIQDVPCGMYPSVCICLG